MDAKIETVEGSSASELDPEHFDVNSENIIETVDEVGGIDVSTGGAGEKKVSDEPGGKKPEEKEPEKAVGEGGEKPVEGDDKKPAGKQEPYHLDPAWQRIMTERDDALKSVDSLTKRVETLETPEEKEGIKDISDLTEDEIIEWQTDDPKAFMTNLRDSITKSVRSELSAEMSAKAAETRVDKTYDAYADSNPDSEDKTGFFQMWNSGKLQEFIEQNPGHNPISAHMSLTADAKSQAKTGKAVNDAKKEMEKQQQARIVTDGLGLGPGRTPAEGDALKDTKKRGGVITVLADRLRKTRQQAT